MAGEKDEKLMYELCMRIRAGLGGRGHLLIKLPTLGFHQRLLQIKCYFRGFSTDVVTSGIRCDQ